MARFKQTRADYIARLPEGAVKHVEGGAEWYTYDDGHFNVMFFQSPRMVKPSKWLRCPTAERRDSQIKLMLGQIADAADRKEKYRQEAMAERGTFAEGEILYTSWGWEQTNIDFYQVVRVTGASIVVRELAKNSVETMSMQGRCTAKKDEFVGPEIMLRIGTYGPKIEGRYNLYKWDGRELNWTAYA
jgi:hypothetical protein